MFIPLTGGWKSKNATDTQIKIEDYHLKTYAIISVLCCPVSEKKKKKKNGVLKGILIFWTPFKGIVKYACSTSYSFYRDVGKGLGDNAEAPRHAPVISRGPVF